ncbi:hypothetical protein LCGC14_0811570 [marine sediment metagenome]|uniref:ParB-like N-terminal domain-containing protein n=1 Tax=marine sediment metagenome TaxID=412755 RepID=A0A0F9PLK6_9ZZZZ
MTASSTMKVFDLLMTDIFFDQSFNCRGPILPIDVIDLARSIQERGLIQPVAVAPLQDQKLLDNPGKKYLLIAGYRRFTAFKINKATVIQAIIREDMTNEADARFFNLSENLQRKELNILQEALALSKLEALGISETIAAERLNMSRGWVQVRYMVLRLPVEVQEEIAAGWLSQIQIRDAYSHFKVRGKQGCFEIVKQFKDDKLKGRKGTRQKVKKSKEKTLQEKKKRSRDEMFKMQKHIFANLGGNSVITRTLAWCAGEITTMDYHLSLRDYAKGQDQNYRMP